MDFGISDDIAPMLGSHGEASNEHCAEDERAHGIREKVKRHLEKMAKPAKFPPVTRREPS